MNELINRKIFENRTHALQEKLKKSSVDALLITNKTNLMYLTGLDLSAGKLLVHTNGTHLFVDPRYYELSLKQSPFPVLPLNTPSIEAQLIKDFSFVKALAFESTHTTYAEFLLLTQKLHQLKLVPIENSVEEIRMIKDEGEIAYLRKAATLGSLGFDFVCSLLKEGISEYKLSTELEIFWKRQGGSGLAFEPIIAFGPNSSMPHYRPGNSDTHVLTKGTPVLIDIGVKYDHYHSDMTRMAYFGEPTTEQVQVHAIVQQAQAQALKVCRAGVAIAAVDAAARNYITAQGYGVKFTHNLGHGVGLDIHEMPRLKSTDPDGSLLLQPGMVITIEPGIYLENNFGVRIEDTIVITETGYENLTNRPTDPLVIT